MEELAENKKQMFFKRYLKAIAKIDSVKRLPFAGKYVLKGDLSILNRYRGVSDALEVMNIKGAVIPMTEEMHILISKLLAPQLPG